MATRAACSGQSPAPLLIRRNALESYRTVLEATNRIFGEVEVGCLITADANRPNEITGFEVIRGQIATAGSFSAGEHAVSETLRAIDASTIAVGAAHNHPAWGPFGHSIVDRTHIEGELLPILAGSQTPRTTVSIELASQSDAEGARYFLDPLARASLVLPSAPTTNGISLELEVAVGSATSIVVMAPDYQSRIYALRQVHRFTPAIGCADPLVHEQWCEEPFVELTDGASTTPLSPEEATEIVRRWVWVERRKTYSVPPALPPHKAPRNALPSLRDRSNPRARVRESFGRTLGDARDLASSILDLVADEVEQRVRRGRYR